MSYRLKTEFGAIDVRESSWGGYVSFAVATDVGDEIDIYSPDWDEPEEYELEMKVDSARLSTRSEIEDEINLLRFGQQLIGLLEDATEESRAEAVRLREQREEEERRAEEEREQRVQERKDRLMMEFMGEEVKVRERGYQTMRRAIIAAYQREWYDYDKREYVKNEEYTLKFDYIGREERTQSVEHIKRLDVKVGSRWKTLWDDGADDIYGEQYLATSAKPTGEMYDEMNPEEGLR